MLMAVLKYKDPADGLYKPVSYGGVQNPVSMNDLTDADTATVAPAVGLSLVWDGTNWVPAPAIPAGSVVMWMGVAAPVGWQICDGTLLSRTEFADLFAVIGTTYGIGDGVSTFASPNMQGRIPVAVDSTQTAFNAPGKTGGANTHQHQHVSPTSLSSTIPLSHIVDSPMLDADGSTYEPWGIGPGWATTQGTNSSYNNLEQWVVTSTPISSHPPYIVINFIIKL